MHFNRYGAKMAAKASMKGAYPHPMLVTLIFLLATMVLTMVVNFFVANPFNMAMNYLAFSDYDPFMVLNYVFTPMRVGLFSIITLLMTLYSWVMSFGYVSYSLRLARGEQPSYHNLLDGFSMIGRVLLVNFLTFLFTFLWGMLAMLPYIVLLLVAAFTQSYWLIALAVIAFIGGMVVEIMISYRYRLASMFLLDNPGMGALEAITRSKQTMRGWKGTLFVLDLSFIGWMILTPFTLYILLLWLQPYMSATQANFYDFVVHGSFGPMAPAQEPPMYPDPGPDGGGDGGPNGPGNPGGPELPF